MADPNRELPVENATLNWFRKIGLWCVLIAGALILCVGLPLAAMRL